MTFVIAKVIPPERRRLLLPGKRPRDPHLQRVRAISRHHPVGYREDGGCPGGKLATSLSARQTKRPRRALTSSRSAANGLWLRCCPGMFCAGLVDKVSGDFGERVAQGLRGRSKA